MDINIKSEKEEELKKALGQKHDPESERMVRFLAMPDLSREEGSPIHELIGRLLKIKIFEGFDIIKIPEIVPAHESFDLFDFPADHPARSRSDTYYVDDKNILRTHTTVMWYYYLADEAVKKRMAEGQAVGSLSFGKVYRKDEIDRHHMNVFHQIDGWYLCRKEERVITAEDLENVLVQIAKAVFGEGVLYRVNVDKFPYTDPSREMEIEKNGKWVEILGSGVVKGSVLKNFGVDPDKWNGWAFGFGLERLAIASMELPDIRLLWSKDERVKKQLRLGRTFQEVSKFPPITRDVSFVVADSFVPNNYFDLIRDFGGDLVEEVRLLDKYENAEKFGANRISYTYRIIYRSNERTLETTEVDPVQAKIYEETKNQFQAELR